MASLLLEVADMSKGIDLMVQKSHHFAFQF
jgi:hypothetical protein